MAVIVIAGLLALDVCLPVPSSAVSAAAGVLLGFWWGTAVVVYAGVGAWSVSVNSFAPAFLAAMAFPGLALVVTRMRAGRVRVEEANAEGWGGS